jgi:uncharacterized protein (TIGR02246 family)
VPHIFFLLCTNACLTAPLLAVASQDRASATQDRDRVAIKRTVTSFVDAWNKHDAHAFALIFTEDADFTNVAGVHAHGRANVEAFHSPLFSGSHQTAAIRNIRFLTQDLAVVDVDWQMTGLRSTDGTPRPDRKGLLNWVMSKQGDGSWLIEVMHNTELTGSITSPPSAPR